MKLFNHSILLSVSFFSFMSVYSSQEPLMSDQAASQSIQANQAAQQLELSAQSQTQLRAQNRTCPNVLFGCVTLAILAATIVPIVFIMKSGNSEELDCVSLDESMTHECYQARINNCGACSSPVATYVSCPIQGTQNGSSLLNATSVLLNPICGDNSQYCIEKVPCTQSGYVCQSDGVAKSRDWLQSKCGNNNQNIQNNLRTGLKYGKHKSGQKYHKWHR